MYWNIYCIGVGGGILFDAIYIAVVADGGDDRAVAVGID